MDCSEKVGRGRPSKKAKENALVEASNALVVVENALVEAPITVEKPTKTQRRKRQPKPKPTETENEDDEGSLDNEEVEKPEDEEAVEVDQGVEAENAFGASAAKPQSKEKSVTSKKRTKSDDGFGQLMTSIGGLCEAYNKKNEAVTGIASYFLIEKEEKDRRMQLNTEIRKLEGLTRQECRLVAQHIIKSSEKIDMFFSLLEDEKTEYV
ncbi:hypothetical protein COLO4_36056 [Corchorus olitorius]|uniref:Uncharacterized protein n=1 Tax=Corchorus olitorius TaxID=93759 RepID=A0A1R3GB41_9ROSI|nr:hypothetical protein COLO4_36056 [Corchorus olitorius]